MKFSVIVPVYNVEEYLAQCVESILEQDYDDFELILVDDGSPDNCPALCDAYAEKDSRVSVIHKENGGLSDARNAGIRAAGGDYLCFVDSDDFLCDCSMLSKLAEIIRETKADAVQYGHRCYQQSGDKYEDVPLRTLSELNHGEPCSVLNRLVAEDKLMISACSMAISRAFITENKLLFVKNLKTEDLEWAIRLFSCLPTMAFSDEYFYIYRKQREDSISATVDYHHLCDYCSILEKSVDVIENSDQRIQKALMSYLMYHVLIASALCYRTELTKGQRSEILRRIQAVCKERISENHMGKKVSMAYLVYRLFGFSVMARFLGFYLNHRGR
ncbi:MAG: glycosyltransferase family 2 protein [Candidatus Fimenecus sp.]